MRFWHDPDRAPHVRAADADREEVAEFLRARCMEGRLGLDELEERLGRVYAAQTYGDLAPLTADLPRVAPAPPAPVRVRRSRLAPAVAVAGGVVLLVAAANASSFLLIMLVSMLVAVAALIFSFAFAAAPIVALVGGTVWLVRRLAPGLTQPPPVHRLP